MPTVVRVIHVRASRAQVVRVLRSLPAVASGNTGGAGIYAKALLTRLGLQALSVVKEAFIAKADGGADEAGESWKPLSPRTIAYSRRNPSVPKKRPFWKTHPSFMLNKTQRSRWWALYRIFKARYGGHKAHAAATAWVVLKQEQKVATLMETYGKTPVKILRDTGLLYNSLSPGVKVGEQTPPVPPPKPKHQVFDLNRGVVIVGTNRKHAEAHHKGVPGKLPQRRLWPVPKRWPARWWGLILKQAQYGVVEIVADLLSKLS